MKRLICALEFTVIVLIFWHWLQPVYVQRPPLYPECIHGIFIKNPIDTIRGIDGYAKGLCLEKTDLLEEEGE